MNTRFRAVAAGALLWGVMPVSLAAEAGGEPAKKEPPVGVRGVIERITPADKPQAERGTVGQVHVVGKKEPDTETDQAVAIITRETRLVRLEKGKRTPVRFDQIQKGQRVEVRFRPGPRTLIYPPRAAAAELLVLPAGKEGAANP